MGRDVLHLLHASPIPLSKLVQVLKILVAQVILDLRVQVKVRERVRQRRMISHPLRARGRGPARRSRRRRRRNSDEAVHSRARVTTAGATTTTTTTTDASASASSRRALRGRLGLEIHRRRTLLCAPRDARLGRRCQAGRHRVRFWGRRGGGVGDVELERLEIALRAEGTGNAHGVGFTTGTRQNVNV